VTAPPLIALDPPAGDRTRPPSQLVDAIATACADTGFFVVTCTHLEPAIGGVLDAARRLFALPETVKESLAMADRQGFVPAHHRVIDTTIHSAPMEYYDVATRSAAGRRWPPEHELAGFAGVALEYQQAALATAAQLLELLAIGLDLPPAFFGDRMRSPECFLRMMHYEPRPGAATAPAPILTDAHTDYGLITLLATDGVGGLEIGHRDGTWSAVAAPPLSLIVNLGDMLARWTNDRYVSTPHRVSAPAASDRYSVPFFVNPDPGTTVSCLPSCVDAQHPCRYPPVTAGEFLAERIAKGGYMDDDAAAG
jgi:isopenicillin N synthase-like dioxygenase